MDKNKLTKVQEQSLDDQMIVPDASRTGILLDSFGFFPDLNKDQIFIRLIFRRFQIDDFV